MPRILHLSSPTLKDQPAVYHRLLASCAKISPLVEPHGQGEIFLDTGKESQLAVDHLLASAAALAHRVILSLANCKLVARAISSVYHVEESLLVRGVTRVQYKSYGTILQAPPGEEFNCLAPLPVKYLWPLDRRVLAQLNLLGLKTIGLVGRLSEQDLCRQFGSAGSRIHLYSQGQDLDPVRPIYPPRHLILPVLLNGAADRLALGEAARKAAASLSARLAAEGAGCRRLFLRLDLEKGSTTWQSRTFSRPQHAAVILADALQQLLDRTVASAPVYRLIAAAAALAPLEARQLSFFSHRGDSLPPAKAAEPSFFRAASLLQERYPARSISWGKNLPVARREQMLELVDPFRPVKRGNAKSNE